MCLPSPHTPTPGACSWHGSTGQASANTSRSTAHAIRSSPTCCLAAPTSRLRQNLPDTPPSDTRKSMSTSSTSSSARPSTACLPCLSSSTGKPSSGKNGLPPETTFQTQIPGAAQTTNQGLRTPRAICFKQKNTLPMLSRHARRRKTAMNAPVAMSRARLPPPARTKARTHHQQPRADSCHTGRHASTL